MVDEGEWARFKEMVLQLYLAYSEQMRTTLLKAGGVHREGRIEYMWNELVDGMLDGIVDLVFAKHDPQMGSEQPSQREVQASIALEL